jgi:hypothetical protein
MIPAVLTHCAGIDIGKRALAVCLMVGPADAEPKMEVREFSTFTADLEVMKTWLLQAGCTHVVFLSLVASLNSCLRRRVRSRNSRMGRGGTKLVRIMSCRSK